MKANEAPKKIYLEKVYPDNGVLPNGLNYNQSPNDIEYIRTDAFIERMCKWLEENVERHISADGEYTVYYEEIFEELRKYMKGE